MSRFSTDNDEHSSVVDTAIRAIDGIIASSGASFSSPAVAKQAYDLESLDDNEFAQASATFTSIKNDIADSNALENIINDNMPAEHKDLALEAAAFVVMASGDALETHRQSSARPDPTAGNVVNTAMGNSDFNFDFANESFEETSVQKYISQSAYVNAMAVVPGGFEALWYPVQIIAPATTAVDVVITIPKIFPTLLRSTDGTVTEFKKTSIIKAISDASVLEVESTIVVPYAVDATTPTALVPATVVPTATRQIDNKDIAYRPIVFGKGVDLIAMSSAPALMSGQTFNETDSLDNVINIGTVYFQATIGTTTVTLSADISSQQGSLMVPTAEGANTEYHTNLTAKLAITPNHVALLGDYATFVADVEAALGVAAGTAWEVSVELNLSGTVNIETAVMEVFANRISISNVWDANGDPLGSTAVTGLTVDAAGYLPEAHRTNSNLRTKGTIIDSTGTVTWRFPVPLSSPFISQHAIGQKVNTTAETLGRINKIRNNNNAVSNLLQLEAILNAGHGLPQNSTYIGAEFVQPYILNESIDVVAQITSLGSKDNISNLRSLLSSSLSKIASRLAVESGYLNALEFVDGNNSSYEVIIVTSPFIASNLLIEGDNRLLGHLVSHQVSISLDERLGSKIYLSFNRKARSGGAIDPLSFGSHLFKTSLIRDVTIQRNGAQVVEQHLNPRSVHVCSLPVLAVVTISNLENLWVD